MINVPQLWFFSAVSSWFDSGCVFLGRITGFILIFSRFIFVALTVRTSSSTYITYLINDPYTWLFFSCFCAFCVDTLLIPTGHWHPMPGHKDALFTPCWAAPVQMPSLLLLVWHPCWSGVNHVLGMNPVLGVNQAAIAAPCLYTLLISSQSWYRKSGCHGCSLTQSCPILLETDNLCWQGNL